MIRKILLVDDHAVVRKGLRTILEKGIPGSIISEASDGLQAVELARKLKPELILLDIGMPGLNGLEAIRQILHRLPQSKILVLSVHKDKDLIAQAFQCGASGYLIKECAVVEMIAAIETILKGKHYLSQAISDFVLERVARGQKGKVEADLEKLTPREREIIGLVAEGNSNTQIAEKLFISPETVKTHRKNLMRKLGIHNLSALVKYALEHNLNPRL